MKIVDGMHDLPRGSNASELGKVSGHGARLYRSFGKRVLDVLFVVTGTPFVFPFMIIIAVLIKMDGGSVFYHQARLGKDGREFKFWKFRSMVPDADKKLDEYLASNPEAAQEWRVSQKLRSDPRITRVGRVIRKTSLDELPQIWNVLVGDMSLVGPRPMMPQQWKLYPGADYKKLRPGITGFWQVSDRNEVSFAARAKFDADYNVKLSLYTDLRTLVRTVGAVCRGSGV
jgi:lipopolysaccharide/colanic/teichoic acid biosynthesis glycosyltransferase